LSDDEIVDILLVGAPKSWQHEMDCQGIDTLTKTPTEAVEFMERIEMSEDFDADKKKHLLPQQRKVARRKPMAEETRMPMAPSIVCCMATTTPTALRSARHSWHKLRS